MANPKIEIVVKNFGTMTAELYPEFAPKTVENFLSLIDKNFFDGLIFHRIIKGFMIQGGGYDEKFDHRDAEAIKGEFAANGFMQNTLKHTRGVLSMARTSDPNSASSQFFVMHQDAPHLDAQYAGFGLVTEGLDVLDKIANVKTGSIGFYMQDVPREAVVIETIRRA
jgi:peptidyl-prolyl cis-trans isomerase B (cyclophilin B)